MKGYADLKPEESATIAFSMSQHKKWGAWQANLYTSSGTMTEVWHIRIGY